MDQPSRMLWDLEAIASLPAIMLDTGLRIRNFTPAFGRLVPLRAGDIGQLLSEFSAPALGEDLAADVDGVIAGLYPVFKEIFCDGTWFIRHVFPFRPAGGAVQGVTIAFMDISKRKKAEDEIRSIARENPSPIVRMSNNGVILYSNKASDALLAAWGCTVGDKAPEDWARSVLDAASFQEVRTMEVSLGDRCYSFSLVPVPLASYVNGYGYDVTERKKMEEELLNRTQDLTLANQELEAFSYSISHDLRNPLNIILAYCEIFTQDLGDRMTPNSRDALRQIEKATQRMSQIINDLMSLARVTRQKVSPAPVNISELAQTFLDELQASDPGRTVRCAVEPGLFVTADSGLVRLLLENLIRNAWKYTSKKPASCIEVGCCAREGRNTYFVRDDGAGFEMCNAHRLFKPFQRLHSDKEFRGTGLGLALVKRIVDKHGGTVWAEGEKDKGATVYFRLE